MSLLIADELCAHFNLPPDARVDRRIPKTLLLEHGAPTAADKRLIQSGIEEIHWVAALKPTNIGVPAFRDEVREYLEIAVLTVVLRAGARATRLTELVHRAIPYPVVLWSGDGTAASLSLAHKRRSAGESGEVVVENVRRSEWFRPDSPSQIEAVFLASLALSTLPARDLFAMYQGWVDRIAALQAAGITGTFALVDTAGHAAARCAALASYAGLQREVSALRSRAETERQITRRVELNVAIKRLKAELKATITAL